MAQEPVDYQMVLADLESKRAALDVAIAALRMVLTTDAQASVGQSGTASSVAPVDPSSIPSDAFFGLSIGDAAKKYLAMVKRKQTVKEIADALDRGGLPHSSTNFVNTVGTMINRAARTDQELTRVTRGEWGLASWYGNRRPKPEPVRRPKRRKRERKAAANESRQKKATSETDDRKKDAASVPNNGPVSVRQLAQRVLREAGQPLHLNEIVRRIEASTGTKVNRDTLASLFSVTVRKNDMFFKASPGVFGLLNQNDQATLH